jgi:hypothetical protein
MKWLRSLLGGTSSKPAPAPAAVVTMKKEGANLYVLRISGRLSKATTDRIQTVAAREIEQGTKDLKVLVSLNGFEGWGKGDWGDVDFFMRYGDDIARIAAVGEARWKDPLMIFLLAGRRRGEVRYFLPDQEPQARAWLAS